MSKIMQCTIDKNIEKFKDISLKQTFECGQCFRWNIQPDESYIGVVEEYVIKAVETEKKIIFTGIKNDEDRNVDKISDKVKSINKAECSEFPEYSSNNENFENFIINYFDLKNDYGKFQSELIRKNPTDKYLKESIEYGKGIRLLNQNLWEMIISFIISANNNIPRIKGIIEKLSKKYGNEIILEGKKYYTFPKLEDLKDVTIEEYRELGAGFRDKRLYKTVNQIISKEVDINKIYNYENTQKIQEELLKLSGVGPKVADCILLFSNLKRLDVFPVDVWVRRVMNDLYIHNNDENKVNKKEILDLANKKFGEIQGLAQQYLFYWRREKES